MEKITSKYVVLSDEERVISVLRELGVNEVSPQTIQSIILAYKANESKSDTLTLEDTARSIGGCLAQKIKHPPM